MRMRLYLHYITTNSWALLKSINLITSLASLLISIVARRHSKAEDNEGASVSFHCLAQQAFSNPELDHSVYVFRGGCFVSPFGVRDHWL